jgi:hypothetical protein
MQICNVVSWHSVSCRHWWKKALWSRFVWAIVPGCRTGINYSGPMPVPVLARTGTDRSPRGCAAARGGLGHWSRFVAWTGIIDLKVLCFFFQLGLGFYLVCFVFNLMVLHIYNNNEGTTLYIYITHHGHKNILFTVSSVVLGRNIYILQTVLTQIWFYIFFFTLHPSKWTG